MANSASTDRKAWLETLAFSAGRGGATLTAADCNELYDLLKHCGGPEDKGAIQQVIRSFDYVGQNEHVPWVMVTFPKGDFDSRDKFAASLSATAELGDKK